MLNLLLVLQLCLLSAFAWAEPLPMQEVAPGVYVHRGVHEEMDTGYHGDICNIGFVVGKNGVAVIDSGGSLKIGQRLREAIRKVTDLPIMYVINTHVHPDHIFGNAAFTADHPAFVGHARLGEAMERRKEIYLRNNTQWMGDAFAGSEMVKPTRTVDTTLELDLGHRLLLLTAWPPAHTHADLSVLDQETATLWTGDLLFIERTPSMDGDTLGWLKLIPQLKEINAKMAIPGHGPVSDKWREALNDQQRYFEILLADIRQDIRRGVTMESAMDHAAAGEKDKWILFDTVNRRNINILYPQLEWE
jgi:quinoprotein relay system zinc metallohydrolase 2